MGGATEMKSVTEMKREPTKLSLIFFGAPFELHNTEGLTLS